MCMVTSKRAIKLKKDKIVYTFKHVDNHSGNITSAFEFMEWELDKIYYADTILAKGKHNREINKGFHLFTNKKKAIQLLDRLKEREDGYINEVKDSIHMFKAIIPKGSYYVNGTLISFAKGYNGLPCAVSDTLVLKERI